MTKEKLYKLSLDSYHEYPLLAELMAIRDERFKDEQQDSMLCVNGYVGIDTLNNYVKLQQENQQLKDEIDEYKNQQKEFIEYLEYMIKEMENTPADDIHQQIEKDSCLIVVDTILSKFKEITGQVSSQVDGQV